MLGAIDESGSEKIIPSTQWLHQKVRLKSCLDFRGLATKHPLISELTDTAEVVFINYIDFEDPTSGIALYLEFEPIGLIEGFSPAELAYYFELV